MSVTPGTLLDKLEAHADVLDGDCYQQAAATMREAIEVLRPHVGEQAKKRTFAQLQVGQHFIPWPVPGDNSGHGGYLGGHRLFVKTGKYTANDGRDVESAFPDEMPVIAIVLG